MVHSASQRKNLSFISLKSNTEQCFDSTLYRTIYRCIVIHQRQYIDMSTHCIVATLICILQYRTNSFVIHSIKSTLLIASKCQYTQSCILLLQLKKEREDKSTKKYHKKTKSVDESSCDYN